MQQRPHAVAAATTTAAKVTSSVLQRDMRQGASGVCATSGQPSRVPRRDLANRRRYPNYMSTGQQSVECGGRERESENEATRRLISQFMARSACHGWSRGWGEAVKGVHEWLGIWPRRIWSESRAAHDHKVLHCSGGGGGKLRQEMPTQAKSSAAVAEWGKGHRNYFIRATPHQSPLPIPTLFTLPLNGAVHACARRMST